MSPIPFENTSVPVNPLEFMADSTLMSSSTYAIEKTIQGKVVQHAVHALSDLLDFFPPSFEPLVKYLQGVSGKIVCTGMGKSGHIARKIAATLSSTGTPAFFLHPAEAMHGDLGVMSSSDVLLCLSFSGETPETLEILRHSRASTSIVITARPQSTMARLAPWVLALPHRGESCPLNLAPTTSTTLMLVLGDALAMALMSAKNFTKEQFRALHPSGNLGHMLRTVDQVMDKTLLVVPESSSLESLLTQWVSLKTPILGLVNAQGILTKILRSCHLSLLLQQALDGARQGNISLVGFPGEEKGPSNMETSQEGRCQQSQGLAGAFPTKEYISDFPMEATLSPQDLVSHALEKLAEHKQSAMMVVDSLHRPVGIFYAKNGGACVQSLPYCSFESPSPMAPILPKGLVHG